MYPNRAVYVPCSGFTSSKQLLKSLWHKVILELGSTVAAGDAATAATAANCGGVVLTQAEVSELQGKAPGTFPDLLYSIGACMCMCLCLCLRLCLCLCLCKLTICVDVSLALTVPHPASASPHAPPGLLLRNFPQAKHLALVLDRPDVTESFDKTLPSKLMQLVQLGLKLVCIADRMPSHVSQMHTCAVLPFQRCGDVHLQNILQCRLVAAVAGGDTSPHSTSASTSSGVLQWRLLLIPLLLKTALLHLTAATTHIGELLLVLQHILYSLPVPAAAAAADGSGGSSSDYAATALKQATQQIAPLILDKLKEWVHLPGSQLHPCGLPSEQQQQQQQQQQEEKPKKSNPLFAGAVGSTFPARWTRYHLLAQAVDPATLRRYACLRGVMCIYMRTFLEMMDDGCVCNRKCLARVNPSAAFRSFHHHRYRYRHHSQQRQLPGVAYNPKVPSSGGIYRGKKQQGKRRLDVCHAQEGQEKEDTRRYVCGCACMYALRVVYFCFRVHTLCVDGYEDIDIIDRRVVTRIVQVVHAVGADPSPLRHTPVPSLTLTYTHRHKRGVARGCRQGLPLLSPRALAEHLFTNQHHL